jgi:hypothetical protein
MSNRFTIGLLTPTACRAYVVKPQTNIFSGLVILSEADKYTFTSTKKEDFTMKNRVLIIGGHRGWEMANRQSRGRSRVGSLSRTLGQNGGLLVRYARSLYITGIIARENSHHKIWDYSRFL